MPIVIPFSEACERNKDHILEVTSTLLSRSKKVLEIGSGTGQHAVYFAQNFPNLSWQPSDQAEYVDGVIAQCETHGGSNIATPITLDVTKTPWLAQPSQFDLIYSANTLHIMSWSVVESMFNGLAEVSTDDASLVIYGPFKINGEFTSTSNAAFDQSLKARGVGSAIRDLASVDALAQAAGFKLVDNHFMPANNQCLIWQKQITDD